MNVIAIANQKGGVGKTTIATAMASILNEQGKKTLLIDTDLQCNSTDTYNAKVEDTYTLYDVLLEDKPVNITEAIQHTEYGDIIASDPLLSEADSKLASKGIGGFMALKEAIDTLEGYDYVIIDTAPAINMILRNVLSAATDVIIPMTTDRYGLQGLYELNISIRDAKRLNPNISILGILLVRFNKRMILSRDIQENLNQIANDMGTKVFKSTIRENAKVREAQALRTTLIKYDKSAPALEDLKQFVKEAVKEMKKNGKK